MNYLHEASCIHRDLNSKNILVRLVEVSFSFSNAATKHAQLDENLSAKVADFGLSKFSTDEPLSNSNTMGAGTVHLFQSSLFVWRECAHRFSCVDGTGDNRGSIAVHTSSRCLLFCHGVVGNADRSQP